MAVSNESNEVSSAFSEKLNTFLSSLSSLEERNDVPEWLTIFLQSFRLLTSDLSQANSQLTCKVTKMEERLSVVEGELAVQKALVTALQEDRDRTKKKLRETEKKLEDQLQYSRRN